MLASEGRAATVSTARTASTAIVVTARREGLLNRGIGLPAIDRLSGQGRVMNLEDNLGTPYCRALPSDDS